jgi:putative addiction module killer protein
MNTLPLTLSQTRNVVRWLKALQNPHAKARILLRLQALQLGQWGDVKSLGRGLLELRIDVGPGYRIYLVHRQKDRNVLLCGGIKDIQARDISRARALIAQLEREDT